MPTPTPSTKLDELVALLDTAVEEQETKGCCYAVKAALERVVHSGEDFIDPSFLKPARDSYARRLLHKDPKGRYTALVMVWDKGQGTALHDHDNMWCVECVYRGRIKVDSYRMLSDGGDGSDRNSPVYAFEHETTVYAGPGEAGALIPPFDHHTIRNPDESSAVTIHIYGGEMTHCHVFLPV
ncbi:MAG TPA: cysteine dioxygenase family protein, partial [Fimbriimonadaceae bacterium]|nr:cysteine dioxygenase family protein [Fimbriimonadaceae bacterium]